MWQKFAGFCTDSSAVVLGSHLELADLIKQKNPSLITKHGFIQRQSFALL